MDSVTSWAVSLCICVAVCMLVEFLSTDGSMDKILKFVLGVFLICFAIIPIKNIGDIGIKEYINSINIESIEEELPSDIESKYKDITTENITNIINQYLSQKEISAKDIDVIFKDNSLSSVHIYIDESNIEQAQSIKNDIYNSLNVAVLVKVK